MSNRNRISRVEQRYDLRILDAHDDREPLFALRYRSYKAAGYEMPFRDGLFRDAYDDLRSTLVIGAYESGVPVGTMRVSCWRPGQTGPALPCETVYAEVEAIRATAPGPILEISRVAIEPEKTYAAGKTGVYAALVRTGLIICMATDVAVALIGSHVRWKGFYEKVFGFNLVAGPVAYPPGTNPIVLMSRDFRNADKRVARRNPFFEITDADVMDFRERLAGRFGAP